MTVHRINGCSINLGELTEDQLFALGEYIGRNINQAERELALVHNEWNRRALNKSFDPPLLPAS
jgi:hypothetical protein